MTHYTNADCTQGLIYIPKSVAAVKGWTALELLLQAPDNTTRKLDFDYNTDCWIVRWALEDPELVRQKMRDAVERAKRRKGNVPEEAVQVPRLLQRPEADIP